MFMAIMITVEPTIDPIVMSLLASQLQSCRDKYAPMPPTINLASKKKP
jgi:hypothetical protein